MTEAPATTADLAAVMLLCEAITRARLRFTTEAQLQAATDGLLAAEGYGYVPQPRLGPADRPDFLVDGGIALELKVGGPADALERQITRYADHDEVTAVVVVTSRARHRGMPETVNGKPVFVVFLGRVFG